MTDSAIIEADVNKLLGLKPKKPIVWHEQLLKGLPLKSLKSFEQKSGLDKQLVRVLVGVSNRSQVLILPVAGSERLHQLARLTSLATRLFDGDRSAAITWLNSPARSFSNETPLSRAKTYVGVQQVEDLIGRLEHGVFS